MTDLELLFLVLAVIYLWECACWIPRGSVAFLTWTGRKSRPATGSASLGNQRGGFVFAAPIPPLGSVVTANSLPLSISPEAVLAYVSTSIDPAGRPRQTAKLARFDQIKKISSEGRKLLIDDAVFLTASSSHYAAWLAEKLEDLCKAKPKVREARISALFHAMLDSSAVEAKWTQFKSEIKPVRYLTNGVFCYLLIFAPVIIYKFGLHNTWVQLLIGLFALTFATAIFFHRVHKKFYPKAEDERFTHFLTTMLSPATTPRAHDVLSRWLFDCFHPLTLAKAFCNAHEFRNLAQRVLLDVRNPALPIVPSDDAAIQETEGTSRNLWQKAVEEFLRKSGLNPKELTGPPSRTESSMHSYCPRCHAQFTNDSSKCDDCGGLPVVKFT